MQKELINAEKFVVVSKTTDSKLHVNSCCIDLVAHYMLTYTELKLGFHVHAHALDFFLYTTAGPV